MTKGQRRKWIKWLAGILLVLVLALVAGSALYLSDYYLSDIAVIPAFDSNDTVSVQQEGKLTLFLPRSSDRSVGLVFYPGGKVDEKAYAPLLRRLAEQGMTCVLVKMPFRLAVLDSGAAEEAIAAVPSVSRWYVGGHSLGGAMAASYASKNGDKLAGLVLLAAYAPSDISDSDLHVLSIRGDQDGVLDLEQYQRYQNNLPPDWQELVIPGGNHAYFGWYGEQDGDGTASITPAEQQTITVEWLMTQILS